MIELFGHPLAASTWRPLIAAYARGVPFTFRVVGPENPDNAARLQELSPTGQMPALVDGAIGVVESNAAMEYLDRIGDAPSMIPIESSLALNSHAGGRL